MHITSIGKARHNQTKKMYVILSRVTKEELEMKYSVGQIPTVFNSEKLLKLTHE